MMWPFKKRRDVYQWEKTAENGPLGETWNYIDLETGRIDDAEITHSGTEPFKLWCRGAGYGYFRTLEEAKRAAEKHWRF